MFYPVGTIFQSISSTNPGTFMGGTWTRFSQGRVLVGINEADGDFISVLKTGGTKSHTLSTSEIPTHNHQGRIINGNRAYFWGWSGTAHPSPTLWIPGGDVQGGAKPPGGLPLMSKQTWEGYTTTDVGENGAHNNLQPYIAVYMWIRQS